MLGIRTNKKYEANLTDLRWFKMKFSVNEWWRFDVCQKIPIDLL